MYLTYCLVPAQVAAGGLNFVLGFGCVTASYTMSLIPKTQALQAWLVHIFRLTPPFLLGEGLIELTRLQFTRGLAAVTGQGAYLRFCHLQAEPFQSNHTVLLHQL